MNKTQLSQHQRSKSKKGSTAFFTMPKTSQFAPMQRHAQPKLSSSYLEDHENQRSLSILTLQRPGKSKSKIIRKNYLNEHFLDLEEMPTKKAPAKNRDYQTSERSMTNLQNTILKQILRDRSCDNSSTESMEYPRRQHRQRK